MKKMNNQINYSFLFLSPLKTIGKQHQNLINLEYLFGSTWNSEWEVVVASYLSENMENIRCIKNCFLDFIVVEFSNKIPSRWSGNNKYASCVQGCSDVAYPIELNHINKQKIICSITLNKFWVGEMKIDDFIWSQIWLWIEISYL